MKLSGVDLQDPHEKLTAPAGALKREFVIPKLIRSYLNFREMRLSD